MVSVVEASCVVGSVVQDGEVPGHVACAVVGVVALLLRGSVLLLLLCWVVCVVAGVRAALALLPAAALLGFVLLTVAV